METITHDLLSVAREICALVDMALIGIELNQESGQVTIRAMHSRKKPPVEVVLDARMMRRAVMIKDVKAAAQTLVAKAHALCD